MFLKSLEIKNYGPFKDVQKVDFDPNSAVIFIKGTYEGASERSNRAGKSSFVEAILYLLFGEAKDKEVKLIHDGETEMYVSGTFCIDGKEVYVKRGRTIDNKPILDIEGVKGKKGDKEKELVSLMGINCHDFLNTYFFQQNQMHGFMKTGPSEKKKLLQSWFNLERFEVYEKRAKEKYAEANKNQSETQTFLTSKEEQLKSLVVLADAGVIEAQIQECNAKISESKDRHLKLKLEFEKTSDPQALLDKILNVQIRVNGHLESIAKAQQKFESVLVAKLEAEGVKSMTESLKAELTESSNAVLALMNQEQTNSKLILLNLSNLGIKFNEVKTKLDSCSTFNGICPVDKSQCDKGSRIPDYVNSLHAEMSKISAEMSLLGSQKDAIDQSLQSLRFRHNRAVITEKKIQEFSSHPSPDVFEANLISLQENINLMGANLITAQEEYKAFTEQAKQYDKEKRDELKKTITAEEKLQILLQSNINALNTEIGRIKQVQESRVKVQEEINALSAKLTAAKKQCYKWAYIVNMLGKDGIPSLLIENNLSDIEDFANLLLESVSEGFKIEFQTTREVSTKETHCGICGSMYGSENKCTNCGLGFKRNKVKDEIDLKIFSNNHERSFELDSGGGQVLISLALRLGVSKQLSTRSRKCQMLFLDEIFGSLDAVNRELVAKLIFNNLKNIMGFRQIFVITHCTLNDYPYQTIRIIRNQNKNYSKISLD